MAAKKPVVQERVKKAKPQMKVKIPKQVSSSPDKVWRRLMITAIREAAHAKKYSPTPSAAVASSKSAEVAEV